MEGWESLDQPLGEFFNPSMPIRLRTPAVSMLRQVELKARRFEPGDRNSPIKVTATPIAGLGEYEYRFFISKGDEWTPLGDYSPLDNVVFPAEEAPGTKVMVQVRSIWLPAFLRG